MQSRPKKIYLLLSIGIAILSFIDAKEFENPPSAFEKTYVDCSQLISTPFGTYLRHSNGYEEKVRAVMNDCYGTYVMRVETQCPHCGQCYTEKSPPEGMCCPLYDTEVFPGIWSSP